MCADSAGKGCDAHAVLYSTIYNDLTPWLSRGFKRSDFDVCPSQVRCSNHLNGVLQAWHSWHLQLSAGQPRQMLFEDWARGFDLATSCMPGT